MSQSFELLLFRRSAFQIWSEQSPGQDRFDFLLLCALCLSIFLLPTSLYYLMHKPPTKSIKHSFQTLQSFVVPSGSLWPPYYMKLLTQHAPCNISLSLDTLITDICEGRMELRNPDHLLDYVLESRRFPSTQDVNIVLIVENQLIADLLAWRLVGDLSSKKIQISIYDLDFGQRRKASSSCPLSLVDVQLKFRQRRSLAHLSLDTTMDVSFHNFSDTTRFDHILGCRIGASATLPVVSLDSLPKSQLRSAIRKAQHFLTASGYTMIAIEFSTLKRPFSLLDPTASVFNLLPFIQRREQTPHSLPSTSILLTVPEMLDICTSCCTSFCLSSVHDVSKQHEWDLRYRIRDLREGDKRASASESDRREALFFTTWECALYANEVMSKWCILMRA